MNLESRLQLAMLWSASLVCFLIGLYFAIEHTYSFFDVHNYFIAPLYDEAVDAATAVYPVLLGKKGFFSIFQPFADHRVVIARLQEMFDFQFTQGLQKIQPYRLAAILWTNFLLFNAAIVFPNKNLDLPAKILLAGASLILFFSDISINTYSSTMQTTWPYIFMFAILAFICTDKYCTLLSRAASGWVSWLYIALIVLLVNLALYTFNIGLIFWPIICVVLYKRGAYRRHIAIWATAIILTYWLYFADGWHTASGSGSLSAFMHQPFEMYLYFSRIVSIPLIANAFTTASLATVVIGAFISLFTLYFLFILLRMNEWSSSDTAIFGLMSFSFLALLAISMTRFWSTGDGPLIGTRFTTVGFMLMMCLLAAFSTYTNRTGQDSLLARSIIVMLFMFWVVGLFIPHEPPMIRFYDMGPANQIPILEATGAPIDDSFIAAAAARLADLDVSHHVFLNATQKEYKKGAYTFWPAQYIGHRIAELKFKEIASHDQTVIRILDDYRQKQHSGVLLDVTSFNYNQPLSNDWDVIFTDNKGKIIGFAISSPTGQTLWARVSKQAIPTLVWRGAINTTLMSRGGVVMAWAATDKEKLLIKLGQITIM